MTSFGFFTSTVRRPPSPVVPGYPRSLDTSNELSVASTDESAVPAVLATNSLQRYSSASVQEPWGEMSRGGSRTPLVLLVGVRLKVCSVDEELLLSLLRAELPNDPEAAVCELRSYQFVANTAGTADLSVEATDSSLEVSKLRG